MEEKKTTTRKRKTTTKTEAPKVEEVVVEEKKEVCGKVTGCKLLNLREGMSTESKILRVIPEDTELEILETNNDWLSIKIKDTDIQGFVLSKFVEVK